MESKQETLVLPETPSSSFQSKIIEWYADIKRQIKNDPLTWLIILGISSFFIVFMVYPLLLILIRGFSFDVMKEIFHNNPYFFDPSGSQEEYFIRVVPQKRFIEGTNKREVIGHTYFIRGYDRGVFLNTIIIGILTTLISLIIGTTTAFIMARVDFKGKTILSGFLLIPLVLPPFVGGVGYHVMAGDTGLLNEHVLMPLFKIKIVLEGVFAIVFVQSLHFFALVYLNVFSSLMNIDPSMEEQAENLGASSRKVLTSVTIPLAIPGIASGSILVLILAMEDLGTPIIFAGFKDPVAQKTITFYIANSVKSLSERKGGVPPESVVMGAFLLFFAIIGFLVIRKYVALRKYSMISKGRAGTFRTIKPKILGHILIYLYFFILVTTSLIPHIGVIYQSITLPDQFPPKLTWEHYATMFQGVEAGGMKLYIKNTLIYSFTATFLIIILATLAGYVANRKKFVGQSAFDTLMTIPIAIPGVVLGLGYLVMLVDSGFYAIKLPLLGTFLLTLNPLIYPPTILVISYTIRRFPFTVRAVYAGLQQTDEVLEEAAVNLGASKYRVLGQIVVPLIMLNIIAGSLVSLVYIMGEVSTTLVLIQGTTYGTITWKMANLHGKIGQLSALGVFLMILQVLSLMVTNFLLKNRAEAMTGI